MFENIMGFFKKLNKKNGQLDTKKNKDEAKERLHLVLMQDRANVSADFLDMMRQEIIDVIKKYIDVDEKEIDVRLTNKQNSDGTTGAPALYANIPIISIKNDKRNLNNSKEEKISKQNDNFANTEEENKNNEEVLSSIDESKEENEDNLNNEDNSSDETITDENNQDEKVDNIINEISTDIIQENNSNETTNKDSSDNNQEQTAKTSNSTNNKNKKENKSKAKKSNKKK